MKRPDNKIKSGYIMGFPDKKHFDVNDLDKPEVESYLALWLETFDSKNEIETYVDLSASEPDVYGNVGSFTRNKKTKSICRCCKLKKADYMVGFGYKDFRHVNYSGYLCGDCVDKVQNELVKLYVVANDLYGYKPDPSLLEKLNILLSKTRT